MDPLLRVFHRRSCSNRPLRPLTTYRSFFITTADLPCEPDVNRHNAILLRNKQASSGVYGNPSCEEWQRKGKHKFFLKNCTVAPQNAVQFLQKTTSFGELADLLKRCGQAKALSGGRLIHAHIKRYGYDGDTFLGNWLVQMYGECGRIDKATSVFDNLPHPNLYSWTMLMKAYIKNDFDKEALDCFYRMRLCGVEPDHVTFVCTLEACASLGTLKKGQEIHAAIVGCGYEKKVIVGNALVNMYGKCGSLKDAKEVFGQMSNRNEASWNAMISACVQNGRGKEALELFDFMRCEGFKPNRITYLCALNACASMTALEKGHEIHSAVVQAGYEEHVMVGTALVNMYGKCRSLDDAWSVFRQITKRDPISWNAMITACSQNGHCKEALDLFNEMQYEGVRPNQVTLICVLDACASLSVLKKGQEIHAAIVNSRYTNNLLVCNALINMYGKCGSLEKARWVFGQMPRKDVISWNSIIATCAQNGKSLEALNLLDCMQRDGFKPSQITFVCALEACASMAALAKGQEVHAAILDSGYEADVLLGNALVNMYGKCGSLDDARSVFDQMLHRDVVSWSSMIEACAQNGHGMEALKLFHQMQSEGMNPNQVTFLSILSACSHVGYVDHGRHYLESMSQNHGTLQKAEHYVCMIDSLSRAGHLYAAEDLIDTAT